MLLLISVPLNAAEVPQVVLTGDNLTTDAKTGRVTATGSARTQAHGFLIQAFELRHEPATQELVICGPFEIRHGNRLHRSIDPKASAKLELKSGKLTTYGHHRTEIVESASKAKPAK